ncbi:MAG: heme exporter protein CcmD [Neisseriaceae bacterium]|nr:heme exporter protein CcmD [Neisseriaceae bacterium]MBP6861426.1 heme exporter protein CcmD [Neisseriaceae bacterium]
MTNMMLEWVVMEGYGAYVWGVLGLLLGVLLWEVYGLIRRAQRLRRQQKKTERLPS